MDSANVGAWRWKWRELSHMADTGRDLGDRSSCAGVVLPCHRNFTMPVTPVTLSSLCASLSVSRVTSRPDFPIYQRSQTTRAMPSNPSYYWTNSAGFLLGSCWNCCICCIAFPCRPPHQVAANSEMV